MTFLANEGNELSRIKPAAPLISRRDLMAKFVPEDFGAFTTCLFGDVANYSIKST